MSHASWRHGLSSTPSLTPRIPASSNSRWSELPVLVVALPVERHAGLLGGGQQLALDPLARARTRASAAGTRRRGRPRRATARSAAAPRHDVAQGERAQVVGRAGVDALLGAGGDQPDRARRVDRVQPRRQAGQQRRAPEALSSAPGDGGTVSAWAISTRRQRPPSRTPITLRERPRGVEKRCTRTSSPALSNRRRIRVCARRSSRPAAGRGPSREIETATLCACTPTAAATRARRRSEQLRTRRAG